MKIGILETGEVHPDLKPRHGDYPAMFEAMLRSVDPGLEFTTVRVVAGEMPAAPTQADAWIVTGSRHGVYDDLPWIAPLKDFLRDCIAARVPVVGICFGHQILAEALGGRAVKSDRGWGLGVQDYEVVARPGWMADLPGRFAVRALHQDQVVELPPGEYELGSWEVSSGPAYIVPTEPFSIRLIRSCSSNAARYPSSGSEPEPRPRVTPPPMWIVRSAALCCSDWRSVLTAMNSTPVIPASTMRLTALTPPPPTPMTRMTGSLTTGGAVAGVRLGSPRP